MLVTKLPYGNGNASKWFVSCLKSKW